MTQDQPQPAEPYSKLTHRQYRAIECLASSLTVADAAKSAGVGRATLYRWLKDPVFKAACEQRRAETLSYTKRRIKELFSESLDNLADLLGSPDPQVRMQAGKIVMEYHARFSPAKKVDAVQKPYMIESAIAPHWSNEP